MNGYDTGVITAAVTRAFPRVDETLGPISSVSRPVWATEVCVRLQRLARLRANWDDRGSAAPNTDAITFAFSVLHRVLPPNAPAPDIHPLGHGGLQLSWARNDLELDLEVIAPNNLLVCLSENGGPEQEWTATNELSRLESAMWRHFKG
ncbi:MAG TPA: hypothetical protein VMF67_05650 [Rhizomicrobium sp.]|nr:hypothetical protein [Rhizomicrobium sp.]